MTRTLIGCFASGRPVLTALSVLGLVAIAAVAAHATPMHHGPYDNTGNTPAYSGSIEGGGG